MIAVKNTAVIGVLFAVAAWGWSCAAVARREGPVATTRAALAMPPKPGSFVAGTGAVEVVPRTFIMAASSQSWPEYQLTRGGVRFHLGVDQGGVIRYIDTTDDRFQTSEGVKMGQDYAAVLAAAAGHTVIREPGWAYYVQLPSGWSAAFVAGEAMTNLELTPKTPVCFLFKRIGYSSPGTTQADEP